MKKSSMEMSRDAIPYLRWMLRTLIWGYRRGTVQKESVLSAYGDLALAKRLCGWGKAI